MEFIPPRPDYFTDRELAKEWGIDRGLVIRYIETEKLKAYKTIGWLCDDQFYIEIPYRGYKISLAEVKRFEAEHTLLPVQPEAATGEINPKEKDSLLKLVAVMASVGYGYDPTQKKSPIPAQIQNDADLLGISFDVDTVRKWLKKASEFLPPKEEHSES